MACDTSLHLVLMIGNVVGLTLVPSRSVLEDTQDCSTMKV